MNCIANFVEAECDVGGVHVYSILASLAKEVSCTIRYHPNQKCQNAEHRGIERTRADEKITNFIFFELLQYLVSVGCRFCIDRGVRRVAPFGSIKRARLGGHPNSSNPFVCQWTAFDGTIVSRVFFCAASVSSPKDHCCGSVASLAETRIPCESAERLGGRAPRFLQPLADRFPRKIRLRIASHRTVASPAGVSIREKRPFWVPCFKLDTAPNHRFVPACAATQNTAPGAPASHPAKD